MATLLRDRAAAEDVTALAFERAYRAPLAFDAAAAAERAWLFGIARNAALDELRRRSRRLPRSSPSRRATAPARRGRRRGRARAATTVRAALDELLAPATAS